MQLSSISENKKNATAEIPTPRENPRPSGRGERQNTPGGEERRGIWRVIPVGETVSIILTDRSNGSGNIYGFDTVVYEGETFPK